MAQFRTRKTIMRVSIIAADNIEGDGANDLRAKVALSFSSPDPLLVHCSALTTDLQKLEDCETSGRTCRPGLGTRRMIQVRVGLDT